MRFFSKKAGIVPTDFRDGQTFPRRGRTPLGGFFWLARVADKGRASAAGTLHDYYYPCPIDRGMMAQWGMKPALFDEILRVSPDDAAVLKWAQANISEAKRDAANAWLLAEYIENLDRQDREEGVDV
jgi:Domain of unknown function (DUF5069)